MKRERNIFTVKGVKRMIMIYSTIVSILALSMTNSVDNSIDVTKKEEIKRIDIRTASFHSPKIDGYKVLPMIDEPIENEVKDDIAQTEDDIPESDDEPVLSNEEVIEVIDYVDETDYVDTASYESEVYNYVIDESLSYTEDEIYLMAKVCLAEAEGESELGKRLVISTILNRVDSGYYSNNVYDVIYQPYQFEVTMNGRLDRVSVTDDIITMVKEEIQSRTNYNVIYFRTDYYSEYGTPLFQEGSHYFSSF